LDKPRIFTSGQIGLNPVNGQLVSDKLEEQATQSMENLKNLLEASGSSTDFISKFRMFLTLPSNSDKA
jgi:2-iminobutanoate/2-iminopropanoate deaminase